MQRMRRLGDGNDEEEQRATAPGQDQEEPSGAPRPVLPEELTRERPPLEKAYVGVLKEQRSAAKAIGALASWLPCPRHLKRCHGRRVYLASQARLAELGVDGPEGLLGLLGSRGLELSLLEPELELADVPAEAARSRAQMRAAAALWPVHFHPEPRLEALLSGEALRSAGPALLGQLEACARLLAKVSGPGCGGAAAVLEPSDGRPPRLLALAAAAEPERHPLWHAAMLAVDLVAHRQAGGAWPLLGDAGDSPRCKKPRRDGPLVFPAGLALEPEALARLGRAGPGDGSGAYLCTGYWVVLVREPCAMCAMALLHARAAKVFYGASEPRGGVLGSRALLHSLPGLNHRYEVWSGLFDR